ncbi:uncharacterized protein lqfR [Epargyreus clarus]|uniref:uncharacterized protein lqfR n=1 Tax=Epargyreus clarus TaxID=520877 RepID=UPI003C2EFF12
MDRFISMWKVRELAEKVTNVVMNYTEVEGKVREATSDEAWGPTGQQMQELALATFTYEHFPEVMSMLWRRMLHDNRSHWRRTYKCLLLLSYLVRNGSERVVTSAREHIYDLRSLENYTYVDDMGKDQGINVRHKVRELIDFIQDDEKLREERKKAKKNKDKYIGMSSDAAVMGMRSGSGGWGEYSDRNTNWEEPKERNDEDDYEREDSDGDYGHRKPHKENVYRDAEAIEDSPPRSDRVERVERAERDRDKPLSISLRSPARNKPSTPVKKIDLGAAASYGKASSPSPITTAPTAQNNSQELLDDLFKTCPAPSPSNSGILPEDDFDPRADEPKPAVKEADFGDFTNAFSSPPEPNADGFADFSAFTASQSNLQPSSLQSVNLQPVSLQPSSLPATSNQPTSLDLSLNSLSVTNSPPASNLDLLSELSPPLSSPMPSAFSDLDSLTGQFGSTTLQPITQETGESYSITQRALREASSQCNLVLQATPLRCESDADVLRKALRNALQYLPGAVTTQKLCGLDAKIIDKEVMDVYLQLLSTIVRIVLPQWPIFVHEVPAAFILEESFDTSHEILSLLCGFLRSECDLRVLEALGYITLKYARSDMIFVSVIDCSDILDESEINARMVQWESYVQMLITLPERVANRLEQKTPKEFTHDNYSNILVFHIVRCIDFMSECSYNEGARYDLAYLAHLISKVITSYCVSGSNAISQLVDVTIGWSGSENTEPSKFVKKRLIQKLYHRLNRLAIDRISVILLRKCPIDYNGFERPIENVLGNSLDASKDWGEILTYKIPFNVAATDYTNTALQENLMFYLSTSCNSVKLMSDLILQLSNIWADVQQKNVANIEQHMYTSLLLVLAVKYRVVMWSQNNEPWDIFPVKQALFKGMSKHLDVISQEFRCIGMATIETIFKTLAEVDTTDREAVKHLVFDYWSMGKKCVTLEKCIKEIVTKCLIDGNREPCTRKFRRIDLKGILDDVAYKVVGGERPVHSTIVACAVKTPQQTKEIVKQIISVKLDALKNNGQDEEELDSDDDLEPYDMSNDVSTSERKKPNYLRDLVEMVAEAKDVEVFEASLLSAEDLVVDQLKNEDSRLAIELLDLFVHLEEKYHVENFDSIKFNTSVAIVCSHPAICAQHLCKEIHMDVGRYSIATKVFMLDVLSEAANRIADVRAQSEPPPPDNTVQVAQPSEEVPAEEIIRRRLITKTRYFHSRRPHPFARAKKNLFAPVADHFFYPLISGFGVRQLTLSHHILKQDIDNVFLAKYLSVVGNIILVTKNCPKCPKYCQELLPMVLYMRFSPDPKIQLCVIAIIAAIVLALPQSILNQDFYEVMLELRDWLLECTSNVELTMRFGGPKSEAALFAGQHIHTTRRIVTREGIQPVSLLQPITPSNQQQQQQQQNSNTTNTTKTKLGATWADTTGAINIDVDNLLAPRSPKAGPAPSINQLKSSPNSPAHKPNIMNPGFPAMGWQSPNNNFVPQSNINNNIKPSFTNQNLLQ